MRFAVRGDFRRVNGDILVWLGDLLNFISFIICFTGVRVTPLVVLNRRNWLRVCIQSIRRETSRERHDGWCREIVKVV